MRRSKIIASTVVIMIAIGSAFAVKANSAFATRYYITGGVCTSYTNTSCNSGSKACLDTPNGTQAYETIVNTVCTTASTKQ